MVCCVGVVQWRNIGIGGVECDDGVRWCVRCQGRQFDLLHGGGRTETGLFFLCAPPTDRCWKNSAVPSSTYRYRQADPLSFDYAAHVVRYGTHPCSSRSTVLLGVGYHTLIYSSRACVKLIFPKRTAGVTSSGCGMFAARRRRPTPCAKH